MLSFLRKKPLVSICIPAFQSQDFINATIQSALNQTVEDIEIVVSNDGAYPTPDLKKYRKHKKIRIFNVSKQLGWVENSNFALSRARGQYFMLLPHDDILRPRYIEACLEILQNDQNTFAAYSDIELQDGILPASEVRGPMRERFEYIMRNLYSGYSYRALMRRHPSDWPLLKMQPNIPTNFSVDSTWIIQQACFGDLRKVPEPLYWKRLHDRNTHQKWTQLSTQELKLAWQQHCFQMGEVVRSQTNDPAFSDELVEYRLDARQVIETPQYLKEIMP
ncbi:glycosyltransferase [Roseovarius sp. EL26]|uniref:glycosyltransferase family 2 protein n=1 Tax=Roseovarius sp. EL26 TaxID=2126672 RepID=UPI000EA0303D|nr:glycosyltransferase [Roseovarius sp. EL26]